MAFLSNVINERICLPDDRRRGSAALYCRSETHYDSVMRREAVSQKEERRSGNRRSENIRGGRGCRGRFRRRAPAGRFQVDRQSAINLLLLIGKDPDKIEIFGSSD